VLGLSMFHELFVMCAKISWCCCRLSMFHELCKM
jgi:hypothetical protein